MQIFSWSFNNILYIRIHLHTFSDATVLGELFKSSVGGSLSKL